MSLPSSELPARAPFSPEAAESLAARLTAEMVERWRLGERPLPEDFLARHPELWEYPEEVADLIYEELCLRQELGPEIPAEEVLRRFPQWRPQLEVLLDCQRVLGPRRLAPQFPDAGEPLGDFLLLAELGRGAHARVFLASQRSLGGRPVVVKLAPREACEHLSLARLQHSYIVPLYSAQECPERGFRLLCMPYFGGITLERIFEVLRLRPPAQRTGRDLLDALDRASAGSEIVYRGPAADGEPPSLGELGVLAPGDHPAAGPGRRTLAATPYADAVCWIGACLAEALQYAHERGLVHLDIKPSNVLITADGQPMLLDFHLAREPIDPDGAGPLWLGGTASTMSPEQQAAVRAIEQGHRVPRPVDGRSDIYSLGVVLYEALGGSLPVAGGKRPPLYRTNPKVSVAFADLVERCLAWDAQDRYPFMASLANDLRRHLAHLPLAGVRNRSLPERWQKWRRRRPYGIALVGMGVAVLMAACAVSLGAASYVGRRIEEARRDLREGQVAMARAEWSHALDTLGRGRSELRGIPCQTSLTEALDRALARAEAGSRATERSVLTSELHRLAEQARFLCGADPPRSAAFDDLAERCRALWDNRSRVVELLMPAKESGADAAIREDLLDLALFWADLQVLQAPPSGRKEAQQLALGILDDAEHLVGPSRVLELERNRHGAAPDPTRCRAPDRERGPSAHGTAWEHAALGRSLLDIGNMDGAARELKEAVRLQPSGLWPNFYAGLCAYRQGRYTDAATAYSVCIGAAPEAANSFYNRARAREALGQAGPAQDDYDQALRLDPTLASAALGRAMLLFRTGRQAEARADLRRAEELGADPSLLAYDRALLHVARGERAAALAELDRCLRHDPRQADARALRERLRTR